MALALVGRPAVVHHALTKTAVQTFIKGKVENELYTKHNEGVIMLKYQMSGRSIQTSTITINILSFFTYIVVRHHSIVGPTTVQQWYSFI